MCLCVYVSVCLCVCVCVRGLQMYPTKEVSPGLRQLLFDQRVLLVAVSYHHTFFVLEDKRVREPAVGGWVGPSLCVHS